jgi:hypothetical protein
LEDAAQALENFRAQFRELRTAMVDDRMIHGPEHAIRDIGWTRDLEKVAACMNHFNSDWLRSRIVHVWWTREQQKQMIRTRTLQFREGDTMNLSNSSVDTQLTR